MPLEALLIPENLTDSDSDGIGGGTGCNFIFLILLFQFSNLMAQPPESFRLTRSQRGAEKLTEGGYCYGKQRRVGDVTHGCVKKRGLCRAIFIRKEWRFSSEPMSISMHLTSRPLVVVK